MTDVSSEKDRNLRTEEQSYVPENKVHKQTHSRKMCHCRTVVTNGALRVRFKTLSEGWRRKPSAYGFR
jgi:hypothetical protein